MFTLTVSTSVLAAKMSTDFQADFSNATVFETSSLYSWKGGWNNKNNDLSIGSYSGTWKNKKSEKTRFGRTKGKMTTEILLNHDTYGSWLMSCSGNRITKKNSLGMQSGSQEPIDYQCLMQQGEQTAVLVLLPYKKPKFKLGPPIENRSLYITLPDGREFNGKSIHALVGKKKNYHKATGFKISDGSNVVGGVGVKSIFVTADLAGNLDEHFIFMAGLGLEFFRKNDLSQDKDELFR
jgi:hypothetical protein